MQNPVALSLLLAMMIWFELTFVRAQVAIFKMVKIKRIQRLDSYSYTVPWKISLALCVNLIVVES